jgi:hypothetical protein
MVPPLGPPAQPARRARTAPSGFGPVLSLTLAIAHDTFALSKESFGDNLSGALLHDWAVPQLVLVFVAPMTVPGIPGESL